MNEKSFPGHFAQNTQDDNVYYLTKAMDSLEKWIFGNVKKMESFQRGLKIEIFILFDFFFSKISQKRLFVHILYEQTRMKKCLLDETNHWDLIEGIKINFS